MDQDYLNDEAPSAIDSRSEEEPEPSS